MMTQPVNCDVTCTGYEPGQFPVALQGVARDVNQRRQECNALNVPLWFIAPFSGSAIFVMRKRG